MPVTSTTLAGVNVWQLSGNVTDTELKTAWAGLIVNNRYKPGRIIYVDSTCNLLGVRGTYHVDSENLGIILHSSRNKANTLFTNWLFIQTVGLSVGARGNFVRFTNGTTITQSTADGIDMKGGGMIYAVVGNPGGGDPRFLNEMMFGSLDGAIITSQAFAEQELQPVSYGTIWRGLNIQKCANIPIVNQGNQVVYRTNFNTEILIANPISLYSSANGCFISTVMRKQGAPFTSSLANTFGTVGLKTIMILNNWQDESYFGVAKTTIVATNWTATNRFIGGVLKKVQTQPSTLINVYDSRSTTAPAKSTFSETTADFLDGTTGTTTDATTGRASFVVVGAICTGAARPIVRYTGQRFTLQKFGYRVQVETPDMTFGDDDLSAFSPITMTEQTGIVRTQAAITAATTIDGFQDLLEELHVLALAQVGAASYNAFGGGNLFTFEGGVLTTNFTTVNVDATAASKISYNSATNVLTIKSTTLASNTTVQSWNNAGGAVNLLNGAKITGIYTSSAGTSTALELRDIKPGAAYIVATNSTKATLIYGTNSEAAAQTYTVYFPPGSAGTEIYAARQAYGDQFDFAVVELVEGPMFVGFNDIPDEGISQTTLATVQAYTSIETTNKLYDYIAAYRMTEAGIKQGAIVNRAGPLLQFGDYSGVVKQDAASVFSITGGTITLKATGLAKTSRYTTIIATPPAVWEADTTEVMDLDIEDANGDSSVTIQASGVSTFEVWKLTDATPEDDYEDGTLLDTVGTGKYRFLSDDGFKLVIRDQATNYRVTVEMEKGVYTAELFFGAAVQLAQSATVELMYTLLQSMGVDMSKVITNQGVINTGVKKSSLLIPHNTNVNT
jgi:hypothetical protein